MPVTHLLDTSVYSQPIRKKPVQTAMDRWQALGDTALAISAICEAETLYGIRLHNDGDAATVEIVGLDIYDPIKDEVKSRDVHDIAYWMLDDDYDGSNFVVRQVFFCGGDRDEFDEWKKGLSDLAKAAVKKRAEQTLKVELDDEAFSRIYGHKSHPFQVKKGRKIAVRVISQFGEETTKVLEAK